MRAFPNDNLPTSAEKFLLCQEFLVNGHDRDILPTVLGGEFTHGCPLDYRELMRLEAEAKCPDPATHNRYMIYPLTGEPRMELEEDTVLHVIKNLSPDYVCGSQSNTLKHNREAQSELSSYQLKHKFVEREGGDSELCVRCLPTAQKDTDHQIEPVIKRIRGHKFGVCYS